MAAKGRPSGENYEVPSHHAQEETRNGATTNKDFRMLSPTYAAVNSAQAAFRELALESLPVLPSGNSIQGGPPALELIAGDASDRRFYRLVNRIPTAICMQFPRWEGGYGGDPLSWLGMQEALSTMGIPVPQVFHVDPANACIWTEDFGDAFLNQALGDRPLDRSQPACATTLDGYCQALALLVRAQYPGSSPQHPALNRHFDFEKLMFEMKFFITHFIEGLLNIDLGGKKGIGSALNSDFEKLCHFLDKAERVLCHRDYHVRNVMLVAGEVKWIDFQDARMGPHSYDVVSLVRDSYVKVTPETRAYLYDIYFNRMSHARVLHGKRSLEKSDFLCEVAYMGLQRNIKALGSFGYLATTRNKSSYLRYVRHTLDVILSRESLTLPDGTTLATQLPALIQFLGELASGGTQGVLSKTLEKFEIVDF